MARQGTGVGGLPRAYSVGKGVGCRVFPSGGAPKWSAVYEGIASLPRGSGERIVIDDLVTIPCLSGDLAYFLIWIIDTKHCSRSINMTSLFFYIYFF